MDDVIIKGNSYSPIGNPTIGNPTIGNPTIQVDRFHPETLKVERGEGDTINFSIEVELVSKKTLCESAKQKRRSKRLLKRINFRTPFGKERMKLTNHLRNNLLNKPVDLNDVKEVLMNYYNKGE